MAIDDILTNVDYCHVQILDQKCSSPFSTQRWYGLEHEYLVLIEAIQVFCLMFNNDAHKIVSLFAMDHKVEFIYLNNGADLHKWNERALFMIEVLDLHEFSIVNSDDKMEKYDLKQVSRRTHNSLLIMQQTISSEIKNVFF